MAKILDNNDCWDAIRYIISSADKFIGLISPYIGTTDVVELVNERKDINVYTQLFTLHPDSQIKYKNDVIQTLTSLDKLPNVVIRCGHVDFHAKCYFNEQEALVTSMNLSNYGNLEFGVYISKEWDKSLYQDAMKLVNVLCKEFNMQEETPEQLSQHYTGHCILCNKPMFFNPQNPFCDDCLDIPKTIKSIKKICYCHSCGRQLPSISINKPQCRNCWNNYIMEIQQYDFDLPF